jgi:hypothetical protein
MINLQIFGLYHPLFLLRNEEQAVEWWINAQAKPAGKLMGLAGYIPKDPENTPDTDTERIKGLLEYTMDIGKRGLHEICLTRVHARRPMNRGMNPIPII